MFYIAKNDFTYKEAPAVCAAYGARLATYQDMEAAYKEGADWCGHGWVEDGGPQQLAGQVQAKPLQPGTPNFTTKKNIDCPKSFF